MGDGVLGSLIEDFEQHIANPEWAALFRNCFSNTLETTVRLATANGQSDAFVITGDIEAMWLRDSTAQVWTYLPYVAQDKLLRAVFEGVIRRQTHCILIDPYANAFNRGPSGGPWQSDHTVMAPEVYERKWEIDSLCYPIRLAHGYWSATGDTEPLDGLWLRAMRRVVQTFREQQRKAGRHVPYFFQRTAREAMDTLPNRGCGNPVAPVGMIGSAFRPSDDATIFPFLVPSNLFAVRSLRQLAEILTALEMAPELAAECRQMAAEVEEAVFAYGTHEHPPYGRIYAYEVDGFGGRVFMDDANVPSLLSLPYLGCCAADDPIYLATRKFVLSADNPWFFTGRFGEGVGSPHTGFNRIWPIGITMRALTSSDDEEILACLRLLRCSSAGTGYMHEGFDPENPAEFSREWFAWANSLFAELLLKLKNEKPSLLLRATR
jgi:meiotically up-regulated gene 157 (Mug157) protein